MAKRAVAKAEFFDLDGVPRITLQSNPSTRPERKCWIRFDTIHHIGSIGGIGLNACVDALSASGPTI